MDTDGGRERALRSVLEEYVPVEGGSISGHAERVPDG